jgi:hypothetical protein
MKRSGSVSLGSKLFLSRIGDDEINRSEVAWIGSPFYERFHKGTIGVCVRPEGPRKHYLCLMRVPENVRKLSPHRLRGRSEGRRTRFFLPRGQCSSEDAASQGGKNGFPRAREHRQVEGWEKQLRVSSF